MKRLLATAAALLGIVALTTDAGASGDFGPSYTMFRAWSAPDIPLERFQAGDLGIVQPGMRRVYLYTAWRALALGPKVVTAPGLAGGLARADGSVFDHGWTQPDTTPYQPLVARVAALLQRPADDAEVRKITACAPAATDYALQTFKTASARPDATPARLDAWVLAQQKVGAACQVADDWRYRWGNEKPPVLEPPAPPAASEPLYWRQLNEYQRAAWAFQSKHYADSGALFERIGATPGHPMQPLGAYLALRSAVRAALPVDVRKVDAATREAQARALKQQGEAILADAKLAPLHEPTRALLRAMRAGLTPESRLAELSRDLDDPNADPFAQDHLGDWSILMNKLRPQEVQDLRAKHEFADWIETVRGCSGIAANPACEPAAAHALERWQRTHARPWLVAALLLSGSAPAELMQAAQALPPDDPGYLTVRYALARAYRLAHQPDQARAMADSVLQRPLSSGTRNLLREERFAVSTSVDEAGGYLLRTNIDYAKAGMSRPDLPQDGETMLDDDGLAWLNTGLPITDLIDLAGQATLPQPLRARLAGAAWIRAALLDKPDEGKRAGTLLAQLVPATAPAVARYTRAASNVERRHIVLVEAVRMRLAAQQFMFAQPVAPEAPEDATASAWCSFKDGDVGTVLGIAAQFAPPGFPWQFPPPPATGHADLRRAELAKLGAMKTATGVFGEDVLAWAASHPKDPELPWLLHVVVLSTRGGCLDPDSPALSRKAWNLLHKRYAGSEWAQKTPYFY